MIGLDWVTVTGPDIPLDIACALVGAEKWEDRGIHGYRKTARGPRGLVATDGNGGSMVQIRGGQDQLVYREALHLGKATRVDVRFDTVDPKLAGLIRSALMRGEYRKASRSVSATLQNGSVTKLCLGSRTSEKYIRYYDKAREVGAAGTWWRLEVECKAELAQGVQAWILGGADLGQILKRMVQFTGEVASFWASLATDIKLRVERRVRAASFDNTLEWVSRQTHRALREIVSKAGAVALIKGLQNESSRAFHRSLRQAVLVHQREGGSDFGAYGLATSSG